MKGLKLAACACALMILASCGKQVTSYRIYDDLLTSFTEALGKRTLVSENLTKTEDGRTITKAEYTYKSANPSEDCENYLYYLLNSRDAAFLADDKVCIDSKESGYALLVKTTPDKGNFKIDIWREER